MKTIVRTVWLIALCVIANIALGMMIDGIARQTGTVFHIGSYTIPGISVQGVLTALRSLTCILLVFVSYRVGLVVGIVLISFNLLSTIIPIIRVHTLMPLPGTLTSLVSLITFLVIYSFYKRAAVSGSTDFITGLKNRRTYVKEVYARISSSQPFCLACIEIEAFKHINDTYGMQNGDRILQKTADRLIRTIGQKGDIFKITGAVFAIFFEDEAAAKESLEQLLTPEKIQLPNDKTSGIIPAISVSLAVGVALFPQNSTDATELMTKADTALNAAKKSETKKIRFYTEDLESAETKQREAEALVHEALTNEWFYLVYQPQFTLAERKLRGFETLIRCKKPDGTVISPVQFIPAAEKSNLILKIDEYVLRRALCEFKPVIEEKGAKYIISVNVSAKTISTTDFADHVKTLLAETQFPAQCLEIEITEYSLADSLEITIANINSLREIGVKVALDDFGTGYTSIAQLMKLPINLLKIDKSLIDNIESNQSIRDLVDSVIYMGHVMNCEVISEGVENEKQIGVLREHNCDFVQGFVWGKPLSFADAVHLCS